MKNNFYIFYFNKNDFKIYFYFNHMNFIILLFVFLNLCTITQQFVVNLLIQKNCYHNLQTTLKSNLAVLIDVLSYY